jgi:lipopolysaccharide biosynthesis glycosyltransferase
VKVYLGFDAREPEAYAVAAKTLRRTSGLDAESLEIDRLRDVGLLTRIADRRGGIYDLVSNAPASTEFALSRFVVPIICQSPWALFADSDVVFLRDVHEIMQIADPRYAVQVVKHDHRPTSATKMDGQIQQGYARKNWSSVMLFNIRHQANARLTLRDVNERRGLWLHQFGWLADDEIGELPREWNWLVGAQPKPRDLAIAHFTNGGPFTTGWQGAEHDELWLEAAKCN